MTETWRVGTLEVAEEPDPVSLDPITVFTDVYDGPGRFKAPRTEVSERDAGGQIIASISAELHLPSGTTGIEIDMFAICDASPDDPSLVGRVVRIKGPGTAGQTTAARFTVEETGETIPEGS